MSHFFKKLNNADAYEAENIKLLLACLLTKILSPTKYLLA